VPIRNQVECRVCLSQSFLNVGNSVRRRRLGYSLNSAATKRRPIALKSTFCTFIPARVTRERSKRFVESTPIRWVAARPR